MPVLQVGAGFAFTRDLNALTTTRQKFGIAMFKGGNVSWKAKQEFASGEKQIAMYAANIEQEVGFELKFQALEMAQLNHVFLSQYLVGGAPALSKFLQIDDPKTVTTNAITLALCESVLEVRTPVALGAIPAGSVLKRIASGTPTTGFYVVTGEGTASATITFATADGTAIGANLVPVTWLKKATTDTNQFVLQNAIVQQSVYFGLELAGKFNGQDVVLNANRAMVTELPNLFDSGDKFAERVLKGRLLADPLSGRVFDITASEGAA